MENRLRDVQEKSFLAHDLMLYLDTHPDDREAFYAYQRALDDRREAVNAYEQQGYALRSDGLARHLGFDWVDEPYPWQ